MKESDYTIQEDYIDDPHWNSGFYECTITLKNGYSFTINGKKSQITPDKVEERLISKLAYRAMEQQNLYVNVYGNNEPLIESMQNAIENNFSEFNPDEDIEDFTNKFKINATISFQK